MAAARSRHLRAAALRSLRPDDAARVAWTGARFLTIADVSVLRHLVFSLGLSRTRLLSDDSPQTQLEGSGGNWEAVMSDLGAGPGGSVADLAAAFRTHVAPSAAAASTRAKDWAGWRAVLTWAAARGVLGLILPMDRQTLEALIWDMLSCQCTTPIIKSVVDGIQARHRRFSLPSPLAGPRAYSRIMQSLSRFQGTQSAFKSPITPDLVRASLLATSASPADERNALAVGLATICGVRPAEGAALQACDLRHGSRFAGTAAINVMKRKQDQDRKGHHPRIGRGSRPETDIVGRLRAFLVAHRTAPGPGCTKAARPHARCPACFPLFPVFLPGGAPRRAAPSPSAFSDMILKGLRLAGATTSDFSGVCAPEDACRRPSRPAFPRPSSGSRAATPRAARRALTSSSPSPTSSSPPGRRSASSITPAFRR